MVIDTEHHEHEITYEISYGFQELKFSGWFDAMRRWNLGKIR